MFFKSFACSSQRNLRQVLDGYHGPYAEAFGCGNAQADISAKPVAQLVLDDVFLRDLCARYGSYGVGKKVAPSNGLHWPEQVAGLRGTAAVGDTTQKK